MASEERQTKEELISRLERLTNVCIAKGPIAGENGTEFCTASGGKRYVKRVPTGYLWVRPDGVGKIVGREQTRETLLEIQTFKIVDINDSNIPSRVKQNFQPGGSHRGVA